MAKKNPVSEYLAKIGKRGGQAKVAKGTATLSPEERKRRASEAAAARWAKPSDAPPGKPKKKAKAKK